MPEVGLTPLCQTARMTNRGAVRSGANGCLEAWALVHFDPMNWKRILAYVTGSVDEELLARNDYLVTENRILRNQIKGRIRLTDPERISLANPAGPFRFLDDCIPLWVLMVNTSQHLAQCIQPGCNEFITNPKSPSVGAWSSHLGRPVHHASGESIHVLLPVERGVCFVLML